MRVIRTADERSDGLRKPSSFCRKFDELIMPNDAKFGLVVGVGLVIAVAVVFFNKETTDAGTATQPAAVSTPQPAPSSQATVASPPSSTTGRTMSFTPPRDKPPTDSEQ